jgi:hypothetical protein
MANLKTLLKMIPLLACAYVGSAQALVINYSYNPAQMNAQALAGFNAAAQRWSSVLKDDVRVNLTIGFSKLGPNVLGSTRSQMRGYYYEDYRNALVGDARGATDRAAVAGLPTGPCFKLLINGTSDNPAGPNSGTPYLDENCDANNQVMYMTQANARAAGLYYARDSVSDGTVEFSSDFAWDFDPTNGIAANAIDFIGVATHEIGHALGFVSGVDYVDILRDFDDFPLTSTDFSVVAPADLFRCSPKSKADGADLDFSADTRDKFFSFDNCTTAMSIFSTGDNHGDGEQASHWKDNLGIGIMDPTTAYGERLGIKNMDITMFDAIGWNVVPEPGSITLMLLGAAGLAGARRPRK